MRAEGISAPSPLLGDVQHGKIQHLEQAVICRENSLGFSHLKQLPIEALYGISRINQSPKLLWELEICAEILQRQHIPNFAVRYSIPNELLGTSKNRFEKGKWVECAECDESRRSKAVCLTRRFEEAVGVLYTFSLKQGF